MKSFLKGLLAWFFQTLNALMVGVSFWFIFWNQGTTGFEYVVVFIGLLFGVFGFALVTYTVGEELR